MHDGLIPGAGRVFVRIDPEGSFPNGPLGQGQKVRFGVRGSIEQSPIAKTAFLEIGYDGNHIVRIDGDKT